MRQVRREPGPGVPPSFAEELRVPPDGAHDPQAQALEAARAEFRAAWQAKRERAERLRGYARVAGRLGDWSLRGMVALVFLFSGVMVLGLLQGAGLRELLRSTGKEVFWGTYLLSNVITGLAQFTMVLLNRSAARLEAAALRCPISRPE